MPRTRTADGTVVWILSILLAIVFLLAGIPKLVGASAIGLEAAAMQGFPTWIRVLIGIAEVVGAIALLIPPVATLAALLLALLMVPATVTQHLSAQGGTWVPVIVFLLLLYVAWRRSADVVHDGYRAFIARPHRGLRNGIVAGLIGATAIAIWFLIVDAIAGHPLYTPATLGRGLIAVFGPVPPGTSTATFVITYTIFHYAAFILTGLIAEVFLRMAGSEPSVLLGFVLLFVAFEVGFYAFVGLLQQATPLGELAWWQVLAGNLIAAVAMGSYLWRMHPALRDQFAHALDVRHG